MKRIIFQLDCNENDTLRPIDVVSSSDNKTFAFRTRIIWCIIGPVNVTCHKRLLM